MADVRAAPPPQDIRPATYSAPSTATTDLQQTQQGPSPTKRRQDFSREKPREDELRLGDYILGQTLGKGEFGQVKLGWKKQDSLQVAIKLIRRRKLDNPGRLAKVHREITILRELDHPNIVRLHETIETSKTIGIILEYASGGELFDYILHHRYLRDNSARRLFAQLVSGVGYLHKKGIIHRDLKLENLLLDRNKNIIISDFGFANTFDPTDELSSQDEKNLHRKEWVQLKNLDVVDKRGFRRGDLMMTSCGSPCYAAPELVVSDGLYTGRKVDVWSCGVILYAMLAGYLPFDDDPKNPEGDNINALYQYIINTPLVFPEYVTPHARDLLKRVLVPKPRDRADLFEVARHSWLSEYSNLLESITSTVASPIETIFQPPIADGNALNRSASVRNVAKPSSSPAPGSTGLSRKNDYSHLALDEPGYSPTSRDAKRRTVQLEYVPPNQSTSRVPDAIPGVTYVHQPFPDGARAASSGGAIGGTGNTKFGTEEDKPAVPEKDYYTGTKNKYTSRPGRDVPRSISDSTAFTSSQQTAVRPSTQGSMTGSRLPSRGSYGQLSAPNVTAINAQGRFSQPQKPGSAGGKQYMISGPITPGSENQGTIGIPSTQSGYHRVQGSLDATTAQVKTHKRSNTLGGLGDKIMSRAGSLSRRNNPNRKQDRMYPPTSMRPITTEAKASGGPQTLNSRPSTESRRSFGFGRKSSDLQGSDKRSSRRFSFIPRYKSRSSQAELRTDTATTKDATDESQVETPSEQYPQEKRSGIFWRNRRFNEAYDEHHQGEAGSSNAARRVMEFFRRRR